MGIQETPAESIFSAVLLMDSEEDRIRYENDLEAYHSTQPPIT